MNLIKTKNKIPTNALIPSQLDFVGFCPVKTMMCNGSYLTKFNIYKLKELIDENGDITGYIISEHIQVDSSDVSKNIDSSEMQNIYETLVAGNKIDPTAPFLVQEQDLLLHGGILMIIQYNLFNIKSETELEIVEI